MFTVNREKFALCLGKCRPDAYLLACKSSIVLIAHIVQLQVVYNFLLCYNYNIYALVMLYWHYTACLKTQQFGSFV